MGEGRREQEEQGTSGWEMGSVETDETGDGNSQNRPLRDGRREPWKQENGGSETAATRNGRREPWKRQIGNGNGRPDRLNLSRYAMYEPAVVKSCRETIARYRETPEWVGRRSTVD